MKEYMITSVERPSLYGYSKKPCPGRAPNTIDTPQGALTCPSGHRRGPSVILRNGLLHRAVGIGERSKNAPKPRLRSNTLCRSERVEALFTTRLGILRTQS